MGNNLESPYVGQLLKHSIIKTIAYLDSEGEEVGKTIKVVTCSTALILKISELMGDAGCYPLAEVIWDDGEQGFIRAENSRDTRTKIETIIGNGSVEADDFRSSSRPFEAVALVVTTEEIIELL